MMRRVSIMARYLTGSFTPFLIPFWGEEERGAVKEWLAGATFPDASERLEEAIASQLEGNWSIRLLNSGRAAIQLALEAMELPAGSEVLLPSFSCTGVVMPVIQAGLQPVFVDVDQQFNMRLESVLEADAPNVRALILPHLSGCWARDTEKILQWARSRGIFIVEDCAQAFGLRRDTRLAGTFGDVGIFSSGLGKPIFGPGGGWVISRHPSIAKFLRSQKLPSESRENVSKRLELFVDNYSVSPVRQGRNRFKHAIITRRANTGSSAIDMQAYCFSVYSMSGIEAHLALIQVEKLQTIIQRRREFAARWRDRLNRLGLTAMQLLPAQDNIYTKMLLSFVGEAAEGESQGLKEGLWSHGVETESSYTPLHLRSPFAAFRRTSLLVTERQWRGAFAVPVRPNLDSDDWKRIDNALSTITRPRWHL